jgi:hypothetical protein
MGCVFVSVLMRDRKRKISRRPVALCWQHQSADSRCPLIRRIVTDNVEAPRQTQYRYNCHSPKSVYVSPFLVAVLKPTVQSVAFYVFSLSRHLRSTLDNNGITLALQSSWLCNTDSWDIDPL